MDPTEAERAKAIEKEQAEKVVLEAQAIIARTFRKKLNEKKSGRRTASPVRDPSVIEVEDMTTSYSDKESLKIYAPTFDGDKEQWRYFRPKMESYLSRMGMGSLLSEDPGDKVKPDDHVWSTDAAQAENVKKGKELQALNCRAAGTLLNCIVTTTKQGQAVFDLLAKHHNAKKGFVGGHFYKEWQALIRRYESVDVQKLEHLKSEYYSEHMDLMESPSVFVTRMERLKDRLCQFGHQIDDTTFLKEVLGRLPKSKDPSHLGPYQARLDKWFDKIAECEKKKDDSFVMEDLVLELELVHAEIQEAKKKGSSSGAGERGFYSASRQFKGKCHKCGQLGHKRDDCPENRENRNRTNGRRPARGPGTGRSNYGRGRPNGNRRNQQGSNERFNGVCFHCKKRGHKKIDCRSLHGNPDGRGRPGPTSL